MYVAVKKSFEILLLPYPFFITGFMRDEHYKFINTQDVIHSAGMNNWVKLFKRILTVFTITRESIVRCKVYLRGK